MRAAPALFMTVLLAACGKQPQVERIAIGEADAAPALNPLPNSLGARWHVSSDGKGVELARPPGKPFLTLHCTIAVGVRSQLTVIRHARSEPGAKALFAVLGNGVVSRM